MKRLSRAEGIARCKSIAKSLEAEGKHEEAARFWEAVKIGESGIWPRPKQRDWLYVKRAGANGQTSPEKQPG